MLRCSPLIKYSSNSTILNRSSKHRSSIVERANCPGTTKRRHTEDDCERGDNTIYSTTVLSKEERPLKRLKDLDWPIIDDEQLSVFTDPLRRDEIKPIRQHEWEEIATSSELRRILSTKPDLKDLLTKIIEQDHHSSSNHSSNRHHQIDQSKKTIKDLIQTSHSSTSQSKQTQDFHQFADIIRNILELNR